MPGKLEAVRPEASRGAALVALAALGAGLLAALLVLARGGELTDTDWRLIGSLFAALYCGSAVLVAVALRGLWGVADLTGAAAVVLLVAIWKDGIWDDTETLAKLVLTALAVTLAALLVGSLRLQIVFTRRLVWLAFLAVSAVIVLTLVVALVLLWSWNPPGFFDGGGEGENVANVAQRVLIALFALSVAGYLATPLLPRVLPPRADDRA